MMTWTKRLLLTCTILGLLATNVLTLTSTAFNAAMSGALATATGIRTVSSMMQTKIAAQDKVIKKQKAATKRFGTRLTSRTKRVAREKHCYHPC
jgi:Pyruvate/2-oxoacid:ferredoxin oxidoreductase gamma subunit